tara:strand:+ start:8194 stop:8568 length:375 start_codon:yes stop_codon:yes gene_type:complete
MTTLLDTIDIYVQLAEQAKEDAGIFKMHVETWVQYGNYRRANQFAQQAMAAATHANACANIALTLSDNLHGRERQQGLNKARTALGFYRQALEYTIQANQIIVNNESPQLNKGAIGGYRELRFL